MDRYQELAEVAAAQCGPSFDEITIRAELDEGYSEIDLRCVSSGEERHITEYPAPAAAQMHRCLNAIREDMARVSGQKWTRCTFHVLPDGTFKFDVKY